jgi:hypothetical protein
MKYVKFNKDGWYDKTATPPFASEAEELEKGNYLVTLYLYDWHNEEDMTNRLRLVDDEVVLGTKEERETYDAEQKELRILKAIADLKEIKAPDVIDAMLSFDLPKDEGEKYDPITKVLVYNELIGIYAERLVLKDPRVVVIMAQIETALQNYGKSVDDIKRYVVTKEQ